MSQRRVVITGIGLITPCGTGWLPYWEAVLKGQSKIRYLSGYQSEECPIRPAGQIIDFDPAAFIQQRKMLKVMSREIQLAVASSQLALQDANLVPSQCDRTSFGISLGAGIINNDLDEIGIGIRSSIDENGRFQMRKFGQEGIRSLYPLWFLKYLPNMPACHISIAHGLQGPSNTITTSSAAGAQAVGEAYHVIQRGDADIMLAGGTDSKVNAMGISRFHLLGLLSNRGGDSPEKIYCPFDRRHDGMVLGEGAGLLILEEKKHAQHRGVRIYGEIAGYGASSDFNYVPGESEDFTGKCLAMDRALASASMSPREIDFLMANGSGIPQDDIQEASAIHVVFKDAVGKLRITAVKPVTGHMVYGAGGTELAAALLSLYHKIVPPLINLENQDPACDLPFVTQRTELRESKAFILNSFGFSGQNASLVVRR